MTQQEFSELTKVNVSADEFDAIETVYMYSDLDKYAFCELWRKMNPSRVEAAEKADMEADNRMATIETIENLSGRIKRCDLDKFAIDFLTDTERDALAYFDIRVWNEAWNCENRVKDIIAEINKRNITRMSA